jgi:hypothetical protein
MWSEECALCYSMRGGPVKQYIWIDDLCTFIHILLSARVRTGTSIPGSLIEYIILQNCDAETETGCFYPLSVHYVP